MMGRLYDPDCAACSCATCSSAWARVPTPAATAPRTDVFTKSRREKVISSPVTKPGAYHAAEGLFTTETRRHRENLLGIFFFYFFWFSRCLRDSVLSDFGGPIWENGVYPPPPGILESATYIQH